MKPLEVELRDFKIGKDSLLHLLLPAPDAEPVEVDLQHHSPKRKAQPKAPMPTFKADYGWRLTYPTQTVIRK